MTEQLSQTHNWLHKHDRQTIAHLAPQAEQHRGGKCFRLTYGCFTSWRTSWRQLYFFHVFNAWTSLYNPIQLHLRGGCDLRQRLKTPKGPYFVFSAINSICHCFSQICLGLCGSCVRQLKLAKISQKLPKQMSSSLLWSCQSHQQVQSTICANQPKSARNICEETIAISNDRHRICMFCLAIPNDRHRHRISMYGGEMSQTLPTIGNRVVMAWRHQGTKIQGPRLKTGSRSKNWRLKAQDYCSRNKNSRLKLSARRTQCERAPQVQKQYYLCLRRLCSSRHKAAHSSHGW